METMTTTIINTDVVIKKTEKYDAEVMDALRNDKDFLPKHLRALSDYHKNRRSSSYKEVIYEFPEQYRQNQIGRLYVRHMGGLQGFPHDIRNPLLAKYNWDVDIENAHYWLIVKLAKEWGNLPTIAIQKYIDNRDDELSKITDNRRNAKTLFLKALFGGNVKLYNEFYDDETEEPKGDLTLLHAGLEAGEVGVDEVLLRNVNVDVVAISAVPAVQLVCDEVLAARRGLQRVGRLGRVLEALDEVDRVLARREGVLARGLDVAPPAGLRRAGTLTQARLVRSETEAAAAQSAGYSRRARC